VGILRAVCFSIRVPKFSWVEAPFYQSVTTDKKTVIAARPHKTEPNAEREKMFAVIKTGGKQYRVAANDLLKVEKVAGEAGDIVEFAEILMVGVGADATIGAPVVNGALVTAEVVEQGRARKVIAFKKRRRQNSKRTRGHRQELTTIRISEILTDGAKPSKKAAEKPAKKVAAPKAEAAGADATETKAAPKAKAAPKKAATKAEKPAKGE
jgi:large subunit ribosomal protein L21